MCVNLRVGTEKRYKINFKTFLSMLLFGQKQNEMHALLLNNQYAQQFLDTAIYNDYILTQRHFCNKETNTQYLLLSNILQIPSSLSIVP